ncbi:MAG: hypothetical protein R3F00_13365 [Dokdonella sp.]
MPSEPGTLTAPAVGSHDRPTVVVAPTGTVPGTYTFEYTATVDSDATNGTINNVVVPSGGGDPDPSCTTVGGCETDHPLGDPVVTVVKSSNPIDGATVAAGQTITYTVTAVVANAPLTDVLTLTDTLSVNQTLGTVTAGSFTCGVVNPLVCTLPIGTVPGSYVLTYDAVVNLDATGTVNNAVVPTGGDNPTCTTLTSCDTEHPLEANVSILKQLTAEDGTVGGVAEPGENLTYTITLTNSGGVDETNFGVTDQLDTNTLFVIADNGGTEAGGIVSWTGLTVPANGSLVLTVSVVVVDPIPAGVTDIANLVYETGTTPPACTTTPGPQCVITPTAPSISVTKALSGESITADGIAEAGEQLTYTITVRNDGGTATIGTIVNETVPLHTTYVSGAPVWTCTLGDPGGTPCDTLVDVPAHDGSQPGLATLLFTVEVVDPIPAGVTTIANAVALNDGTPPDCVALPSQPGCVVVPTGSLSLDKTVASVTATGPSSYVVSYLIEVSNTGGSAQTYTLTDTLGFPAQGVLFTGDANVTTTGGTLNPALVGGQFTPVNGTMVQLSDTSVSVAAGAIHSYTVSVPVGVQPANLTNGPCTGAAGNGFYNQAAVTGMFDLESAACAPVNGDVALIHLVKEVTLGQDANGNNYGDVGDVLNYTFTISNPGAVPLTTVQLLDPRVNNLQCDSLTQLGSPIRVLGVDELFGHTFDPVPVPGTLVPGDSVDCSATYTLTANDVMRRSVVNSATTTASAPAGQAVTATATAIYTSFR